MNIMVVDDEKIQVETLKRGLRQKKFDVVEAFNGKDALKHLHDENSTIDMVLTDYSMPGMNGLELLQGIRRKDLDIPVVIMTAYADKSLVIDAMRNDCDSFIEKPFTLETLLREIKRVSLKITRKKDSREFSQTIAEFVHQINNPLFSIYAGAELSLHDLESDNTESCKDRINRIIEATEKIELLNGRMRNFGREMEFGFEDLEIGDVLNEGLEMFTDLLKLKNISLKKEQCDENITISGNRFELEQMFKNLVLNAIEAMDEMPQKRLEIGTRLDKDSGFLTVHIEDTGCGIPESDMEKIFTPYFTTKEKGTGLGLSIIKNILEKHQGMMEVKSVDGQGTRVEIKLKPIIEGAASIR